MDKYLEKLKDIPYLNARLEKRIAADNELVSTISLNEIDESFKIEVFNSDFHNEWEEVVDIVKDRILSYIKVLEEIVEYIEKEGI